jgi:NTP pyrophosphatase (non-canonical NTP hydrolase)
VDYPDFVAKLAKPGADILSTLDPAKIHLVHMALGVAGEAGELVDAVKKAAIYNKPLDIKTIIEEIGDLRFYEQGIMNALGITDEMVETHNRQKVAVRYANLTYSNDAAIARVDKVGE